MTSSGSSSNFLFILLCGLWYTTSALSSNTGKAILMQFKYPVTLTFVQFGFVAFYCMLFMSPLVRFSKFKPPTKAILHSTIPMGLFQVGGHIFSSIAISRINVSTVHTIKALSPLFTVAAYRFMFNVSYSSQTYISLLPLTLGVMLACSFDVSASNAIGLLCAFGSALVFVSSNIFFKKIMPSPSSGVGGGGMTTASGPAHKLDKINLLLYSSGMAFMLMVPIWLYYDLPLLLAGTPSIKVNPNKPVVPPAHSVMYYFFMNGTVHFAQNIIAFVILSSTSPVTYSIASLIKRVAVICIAIVWFKQAVHPIQAVGIGMTFAGLYMYNNAKGSVEKGERKVRRMEAANNLMLPSTKEDARLMGGSGGETPPNEVNAEYQAQYQEASGLGSGTIYGRGRAMSLSQNGYQHRPPRSASLHIKTRDEGLNHGGLERVNEVLYPSPPLSEDSPPSKTVPLPAGADAGSGVGSAVGDVGMGPGLGFPHSNRHKRHQSLHHQQQQQHQPTVVYS
ncbi:triose-phosphate transporter family-domain-containing protein [Crepidotus variabilis]|uniref:Triose-phosphate transporter family-domain-containing protein n=1 Tax=Crepidotus variabilis TaxID=179855 RepID=A0A9P6EAA8_9AGAR|nr:triose-phosphate transporter family-domain-containing protein [Crepidotus variabilis]